MTFEVKNLDTLRTVEELTNYRDEATARMDALDKEVNGLPFSAEQQAEWDAIEASIEDLDSRVVELEGRRARLEALARKPENVERGGVDLSSRNVRNAKRVPDDIFDMTAYRRYNTDSDESYAQAVRDGAMFAVDKATFPHPKADKPAIQAHIERLMLTVEDPVKLSRHILTTGSPQHLAGFDRFMAAAGAIGSGPTGRYALPFVLDPTVVPTSDGSINSLRQFARTESITGLYWQGVSADDFSVSYGSEAQDIPAADLTLANPTVTPLPVKASYKFSFELGQDWGALRTEWAKMLQRAKDNLEATKFVLGVGTTEPGGIVGTLDPSSYVGTALSATFARGDLYTLEGSLGPSFISQASFLANRSTYGKIRQFQTNSGPDLWTRLDTGLPNDLIGYPAYEAPAMSALTTTNEEIILVFGDFSYYVIVDRIGMEVEIDPHVQDGDGNYTGQRALIAHWRNSAEILHSNAFRALHVGPIGS